MQPPPGTFGGTLGLGGADGFGGTGENNVMYAGEPKTEVDKMFGFALPPDARAACTQVRGFWITEFVIFRW